jgi:hypothetical protein
MAHFYGSIQGNRGEATRLGTKNSGLEATVASWEGAVQVIAVHNEEIGKDMVEVHLIPWHGSGCHKLLYRGLISGKEEE